MNRARPNPIGSARQCAIQKTILAPPLLDLIDARARQYAPGARARETARRLSPGKFSCGGYNLIEVLLVFTTIGILAAMFLPVLAKAKVRAQKTQCVGDLRQIGIGFHLFANDHQGWFPMQVSTTDGGSAEYIPYPAPALPTNSFRHLATLAKELTTPKILVCPSDKQRFVGTKIETIEETNISYYVFFPTPLMPTKVLATDRTLIEARSGAPGERLEWTGEIHNRGNALFADIHVEQNIVAFRQSAFAPTPVVDPTGTGGVGPVTSAPRKIPPKRPPPNPYLRPRMPTVGANQSRKYIVVVPQSANTDTNIAEPAPAPSETQDVAAVSPPTTSRDWEIESPSAIILRGTLATVYLAAWVWILIALLLWLLRRAQKRRPARYRSRLTRAR
jgi:type II secretory pathway pseudopilin PulG